MGVSHRLVLFLPLVYGMFVPGTVFLLVRVRAKSWWPAIRWCLLSATACAFVVGGAAQCLFRWLEGQAGVELHWADYWEGQPPPDGFVWCFFFLLGGFIGVCYAFCGVVPGALAAASGWVIIRVHRRAIEQPVRSES